jgi:hypothetical protein
MWSFRGARSIPSRLVPASVPTAADGSTSPRSSVACGVHLRSASGGRSSRRTDYGGNVAEPPARLLSTPAQARRPRRRSRETASAGVTRRSRRPPATRDPAHTPCSPGSSGSRTPGGECRSHRTPCQLPAPSRGIGSSGGSREEGHARPPAECSSPLEYAGPLGSPLAPRTVGYAVGEATGVPQAPLAHSLRRRSAAARGKFLDRRRAERQIRIVVALYRAEARRGDSDAMIGFRERAQAIFDVLEPQIAADPELLAELHRARRELRMEQS